MQISPDVRQMELLLAYMLLPYKKGVTGSINNHRGSLPLLWDVGNSDHTIMILIEDIKAISDTCVNDTFITNRCYYIYNSRSLYASWIVSYRRDN